MLNASRSSVGISFALSMGACRQIGHRVIHVHQRSVADVERRSMNPVRLDHIVPNLAPISGESVEPFQIERGISHRDAIAIRRSIACSRQHV